MLPFKEMRQEGLYRITWQNGYNGGDFEDGLLNLSKSVSNRQIFVSRWSIFGQRKQLMPI